MKINTNTNKLQQSKSNKNKKDFTKKFKPKSNRIPKEMLEY